MGKKYLKINLSKINNLHFAMQQFPDVARGRLQAVMEQWARDTQKDYDDLAGYGSGLHGKQSFYEVRSEKSGNSLYVAVGHQSYIARFLEVGTKAHLIPHKKGNASYVVRVKGIKGTKALGKVWNKRKREITLRISKEINEILKGGI